MIAGAAAQWLNSREGRKASERERARIQGLIAQVKEPDFDFSQLQPDQYQWLNDYVPEVAPYVEAAAPEMVKVDTADSRLARDAEVEALEEMLQLSRSGNDPITAIQRARAARESAANSQSARATTDAQMARRGMAPGAGLGYAANLQATSDAFMGEALAGEQAAMADAERRYGATRDAASLGGQIYGREMSLAEKNAGIMNDFNRWVRDSRQQQSNLGASVRNEGQRFNVEGRQGVADRNVGMANQFKVNERNNQNDLKQKVFTNTMSKLGQQVNQSNRVVQDIGEFTQQDNQAIQGASEGIAGGMMAYGKKPAAPRANLAEEPVDESTGRQVGYVDPRRTRGVV
jgi:hypothetical protein